MSNLRSHRKIWLPGFVKEIHYFDSIHLGYSKAQALRSYKKRGAKLIAKRPQLETYFKRVVDSKFAFTDDWYRHIFTAAKPSKKKGECTPFYCALPDEGVKHVREICPDVKIIYIIREPFQRALSLYRMEMQKKKVTDGASLSKIVEDPMFQARGDYRSNIPRWESHFPISQILYVPFGQIKTAPEDLMRSVEKHIGIPPHEQYKKLRRTVHATKKIGVTIDQAVQDRIRELTAPQVEFLHSRFGEEFCNQLG